MPPILTAEESASLRQFLESHTLVSVWKDGEAARECDAAAVEAEDAAAVGAKRKKSMEVPVTAERTASGLIVASADDPISTGLTLLHKHRISGLPVHDAKDHKRYIGFIDTMDILAFLSDSYVENRKTGPPHLFDPRVLQKTVFAKPLSTLVNRSGRDPYWPVPTGTTLAQAVSTFFRWAIHRLPLVDDAKQLVGTVSQLDVVRCLHRGLAADHRLRSLTLTDLGLVRPGKLIAVPDTTTVIDVIATLQANKVRSVLIEDTAKRPLACFSATDAYFEPTTFFELEQVALEKDRLNLHGGSYWP